MRQRSMIDAFDRAERPPERLHGRKGQELMLSVLKQGPLSTMKAEADVGVHRGQQAIGVLRSVGIKINTQRIHGVQCYVLLDPNAKLLRVPKTIQATYYQTPHWRKTALMRREFDGHKCVQCRSTHDLEVHHWEYNLFNENVEQDLETLCGACHRLLHEIIKGSGVRFPQFVSPDLLDKLRTCNVNVNYSDISGAGSVDESEVASGCSGYQG